SHYEHYITESVHLINLNPFSKLKISRGYLFILIVCVSSAMSSYSPSSEGIYNPLQASTTT
ncbi:MAG: hypothetical protein P1Q69_14800, partial [Candidatus Thorarchaeota archaeon]|nr:hypothetical protein [Candidatus Thorarchaeota archaeon]